MYLKYICNKCVYLRQLKIFIERFISNKLQRNFFKNFNFVGKGRLKNIFFGAAQPVGRPPRRRRVILDNQDGNFKNYLFGTSLSGI